MKEKMKNNSFSQIWDVLNSGEKILIFPHVLMDGDALGSSVALCKALRNNGKDAYILIDEKVPSNISFLAEDYCTDNQEIFEEPDVCVCVDCGELERFPLRKDVFLKGKVSICIDHHKTSNFFAQYNYIDSKAPATAEIIHDLLKENQVEFDYTIARGVYTGITTDTGNFQYSNTSKKSHLIAAEMFDYGINVSEISVSLYETVSINKYYLQGRIFENMELICEGKVVIAKISQKALQETNCTMEDTEGLVAVLRSIAGVEVAVVMKETGDNIIKASLRSKTDIDVAHIASQFNGGGHTKAAGCTIYMDMEDSYNVLKEAIEREVC